MSTSKIVYDSNTLALMKSFENITHAAIKDCIVEEEKIIFVVVTGDLRKALGKGAENIKKLSEKFQKKVRIVEFHEDLLKLIAAFINPLKVDEMVVEEDGTIILKSQDTKTKGLLIGRAAKNLRALENNIRRYKEVKEIKVQ